MSLPSCSLQRNSPSPTILNSNQDDNTESRRIGTALQNDSPTISRTLVPGTKSLADSAGLAPVSGQRAINFRPAGFACRESLDESNAVRFSFSQNGSVLMRHRLGPFSDDEPKGSESSWIWEDQVLSSCRHSSVNLLIEEFSPSSLLPATPVKANSSTSLRSFRQFGQSSPTELRKIASTTSLLISKPSPSVISSPPNSPCTKPPSLSSRNICHPKTFSRKVPLLLPTNPTRRALTEEAGLEDVNRSSKHQTNGPIACGSGDRMNGSSVFKRHGFRPLSLRFGDTFNPFNQSPEQAPGCETNRQSSILSEPRSLVDGKAEGVKDAQPFDQLGTKVFDRNSVTNMMSTCGLRRLHVVILS